jgi:hypothetical protein
MFNPLKISKLIFLVIPIVLTFLGCDGRYRKYKASSELLTETSLLKAINEQIRFVPEQPILIITDTILDSGFDVKITYYSLHANYIVDETESLNPSKTNHYNFEAKVSVFKSTTYCNDFTLNKTFFKDFESPLFWKKAVMQYVWIDFETSTSNTLYLNTTFRIPASETYRDYRISIDDQGIIEVKEKNNLAKTV